MEQFTQVQSHAVPLNFENIDTDTIVPKQFLKRISRTGYGEVIFYEWRYNPEGLEKDFILNRPEAINAQILLTRKNFGSGSSREHAPWGLKEFGFHVIIAPSFAEIFYQNAIKNGILPIALGEEEVSALFEKIKAKPYYQLTVDLEEQLIQLEDDSCKSFEINAFYKQMLLNGLDDISLSLEYMDDIRLFEQEHHVYYESLKRV